MYSARVSYEIMNISFGEPREQVGVWSVPVTGKLEKSYDGLVQDYSNPIANTLGLLISKPSIYLFMLSPARPVAKISSKWYFL